MTFSRKTTTVAIAPLFFLFLDRLAKQYALTASSSSGDVLLFPGLFFGYYKNVGLAFSLFTPGIALVVTAIVFFLILFYFVYRVRALNGRITFAFLFIIFGGASNLFDRILFGGVTDYILFARSAWNIADIMILAGLILLIGKSTKGDKLTR